MFGSPFSLCLVKWIHFFPSLWGEVKWVPAGAKNGIMNNISAAAFLQFKFSFCLISFVNNFSPNRVFFSLACLFPYFLKSSSKEKFRTKCFVKSHKQWEKMEEKLSEAELCWRKRKKHNMVLIARKRCRGCSNVRFAYCRSCDRLVKLCLMLKFFKIDFELMNFFSNL